MNVCFPSQLPELAQEIYREFLSQLTTCRDATTAENLDDLLLQMTTLKETLSAHYQDQNQGIASFDWFNRQVVDLSITTFSGHLGDEKVRGVCEKIKQLQFKLFKSSQFDDSFYTFLSMFMQNLEPQTWNEWSQKSLENHIGYMLRALATKHYPLNSKDRLAIESLTSFLNSPPALAHRYSSCFNLLTETFNCLLKVQTQQEAQSILTHLIHQEPLRSLIVKEMQAATQPIMHYLAGQERWNSQEILRKVREFQDVLRRWGLIEKDHFFGSQSDAAECLQSLSDFLQEPRDGYSYPHKEELIWQAEMDVRESHWICEKIDLKQGNDSTEYVLKKLGKSILETAERNISTEHLINLGKNYLPEIIKSGVVKNKEGGEIDDLPALEDVLKPHVEKHRLPLCIHAFVKDRNLLPYSQLEKSLSSFFKEVDHFTGYRVKNESLEKVRVPVLQTTTQFKGQPPATLIVQPMAIFENSHRMNLPEINIPAEITFAGHVYTLTKGVVKSGSQRLGHYTFWSTTSEGHSQYADSLGQGNFIIVKAPLYQLISGKQNIALLEYQRKDVDPKDYLIKQKLYQGYDNLCYLVQALYFIFGNPYFSSINQMQPHSLEIASSALSKVNSPDTSLVSQDKEGLLDLAKSAAIVSSKEEDYSRGKMKTLKRKAEEDLYPYSNPKIPESSLST
jgi:hypothetical protein